MAQPFHINDFHAAAGKAGNDGFLFEVLDCPRQCSAMDAEHGSELFLRHAPSLHMRFQCRTKRAWQTVQNTTDVLRGFCESLDIDGSFDVLRRLLSVALHAAGDPPSMTPVVECQTALRFMRFGVVC